MATWCCGGEELTGRNDQSTLSLLQLLATKQHHISVKNCFPCTTDDDRNRLLYYSLFWLKNSLFLFLKQVYDTRKALGYYSILCISQQQIAIQIR